MSGAIGREIGQFMREMSEKMASLEAKSAAAVRVATPDVSENILKSASELSGQIVSASNQAALEQHDTRETMIEAAKMVVAALDRNTKALQGDSDGT